MENTAKNFALQLGSLITLYVSIVAITMLLFGVITLQYPDPANGYYEYDSAANSIRFGIAMLIVFFPAYILLTRIVNTIRRHEKGTFLTLTKWLIYLSLVVGGATLLGDLVAVIFNYLNGELTVRFILKAITMFIVVGSAFVYYLFEARGYWQTHEMRSIQYAGAATVLVLIALVLGFTRTEAPSEVREMKLDAAQINDLRLIQSQIMVYFETKGVLPNTISDAYGELEVPVASEGRDSYVYEKLSESQYNLCAEFAYPSTKSEQMMYSEPVYRNELLSDNWNHAKGTWCFERVVNTESTPQVTKPIL